MKRCVGIPVAALLPCAVAHVSASAEKSGAQVRGVFAAQAADNVDGGKVLRRHELTGQQPWVVAGCIAGGVLRE